MIAESSLPVRVEYLRIFCETFERELTVGLGRSGTGAKQLEQLLGVTHNRPVGIHFGLCFGLS